MVTATRYIGTCPVCYGQHKLHKGVVVLHGYLRPGDGYIRGNCPGVGWQPFELSPDGTIAFIEGHLQPDLDRSEQFLNKLLDGSITELRVEVYEPVGWGKRERKFKTITPDDVNWRSVLRSTTINTENHIRYVKRDIDERTQKVAAWRLEPVHTEQEVVQQKARITDARRAQIDEARAGRRAKREALDAKARAREQEQLDLIEEYRELFHHLAAMPQTQAVRAEAKLAWVKMHKRMDKKGYLHFYPHKLQADESLETLGLALPYLTRAGMAYSNDLGWEPRP